MNHPVQPLQEDTAGTLRFKENAIVRYLLDKGPFDLNHLAMQEFSADDREQFAQLIGYSLDGYASLSYVTDVSYETARKMADDGLNERDARIAALEAELTSLREAADALRGPLAVLLGMHPDDLAKQ